MLSFLEHMILTEAQQAGTIKGSGAEAERHKGKYLDPHINKGFTHTTARAHGNIPAGSKVQLHQIVHRPTGYHAVVSSEDGQHSEMPVSKLHKPVAKTQNRGHDFENAFINHLKHHGLMRAEASGAGSSAGTDFHVINKRNNTEHQGKVQSHGATELNGETKQDHTAAMGQLTIRHDPKKGGWHIPDEARAKRPKYAAEIEKAGIIDHMNKHHPDPNKTETTESGRAKSIVMKHHNMDPGKAYLEDHHVDLVHVGGGKGTYAVGKDKTGHGLPQISGKGKWTVREKQAGNKTSRTVMFQPDGAHGLTPSHVDLEKPEHVAAFKKTLGH